MKASKLLRGKRAIHMVRFPRCNFRCPILPDLPELEEQREADRQRWESEHPGQQDPGEDIWVGLRVMDGTEIADVLADARKFAKDRGVDDPKQGDPLYDLGVAVHTLAVACIDPDHPDQESPDARFFDGGVKQILAMPDLGRDGIVYLHEQQETWQDLCSPQAHKIDVASFEATIADLAGPEGFGFFCQLRPGLRWIYMRSMASLLASLPMLRSGHTLPSESDGNETASAPSKTTRKSSKSSRRAKKTGSKRRTAEG